MFSGLPTTSFKIRPVLLLGVPSLLQLQHEQTKNNVGNQPLRVGLDQMYTKAAENNKRMQKHSQRLNNARINVVPIYFRIGDDTLILENRRRGHKLGSGWTVSFE